MSHQVTGRAEDGVKSLNNSVAMAAILWTVTIRLQCEAAMSYSVHRLTGYYHKRVG